MSRIDDLIKQYAPDGVEYRPLGELLDYEQPGKYLVASTAYDDSFMTPVLTAGRTFVLGYTDESEGVYNASRESPVVIFDDFTTAFKWVDFKFKAKSSAMKMLTPKPGIFLRYVWYAMQTISYRPRDHARQWIGTYSTLRVPIPPTAVQREIVRILDAFIELEAELEAERRARRQQYAYYRDLLLTFNDSPGVKWIPMGEFGTFIRGRRFTKDDMVAVGIPCIHYGEIYTHYGVHAVETRSHVREEIAGTLRYAQTGDVVVAGVGETAEDVAKAVAWLGTGGVAIHDDSFAFRSEVDPTYIAYVMQTAAFHTQKAKYVARGKVKRVGGQDLSRIVVPVPPVDEQQRIVSVLNNFDALVNDLSSGLPAEIEARRQQYAYYRDRLLTFEQAAP